jgi:hypothetical protein
MWTFAVPVGRPNTTREGSPLASAIVIVLGAVVGVGVGSGVGVGDVTGADTTVGVTLTLSTRRLRSHVLVLRSFVNAVVTLWLPADSEAPTL